MRTLRGGKPLFHSHFTYEPNGLMMARGCPDPRYAYSIDGASIPRWAQWLIRKDEKTLQAAGPHDLNYQLGRLRVWDGVKDARRRIDRQFLSDMKRFGVGWTKRRIMYAAVRVGGASSFVAER